MVTLFTFDLTWSLSGSLKSRTEPETWKAKPENQDGMVVRDLSVIPVHGANFFHDIKVELRVEGWYVSGIHSPLLFVYPKRLFLGMWPDHVHVYYKILTRVSQRTSILILLLLYNDYVRRYSQRIDIDQSCLPLGVCPKTFLKLSLALKLIASARKISKNLEVHLRRGTIKRNEVCNFFVKMWQIGSFMVESVSNIKNGYFLIL